jgi:hypothetical protein
VANGERDRLGSLGSSDWLRGLDLNQGPLGYEPNELPDCSTPLFDSNNRRAQGQTKRASLGCQAANEFQGVFLPSAWVVLRLRSAYSG